MANLSSTPTISSAIHKIQLHLLETPSSTERRLLSAAALLAKPDYEDVVVERSISNLCGYPLCPNPLPSERQRKGRYRVSLREHRVYDLEETYKYCSPDCLIGSRAFKESLSDERRSDLDFGPSKVDEVLRLFEDGSSEEDLGKDGDLGISKLMIKEKGDAGVGEVKLEEWIGPSNAIEGYVPLSDRGLNLTSRLESREKIDDATSKEVDSVSGVIAGDEIGADPKKSSVMSKDASEMLTDKLGDLVLEEKKAAPNKTSLKSSKLKTPQKANDSVGTKGDLDDVGFTSSIIVGDGVGAALPESSLVTTQDISEMIAKELEDAVIAEKKATTRKKPSKSSKLKSRKKVNDHKNDNLDFRSTILIGDKHDIVAPSTSSVTTQNGSKQSVEGLEDDVHLRKKTEPKGNKRTGSEDVLLSSGKIGVSKENELRQLQDGTNLDKKKVSQETALKSSFKTSGSKVGNRSVKWADERSNDPLEDKKDVSEVSHEEDVDKSLRLASAEACAAALTQAAEAVASGEAEASNAVSGAGILILPQPQYGNEEDSEADDIFEFDQGLVKWPKKTVLLDTDMFDVEDSWHDTPPEGFSLTLSSFATMWMALFGWITCSSLAYIYGREESLHEEFLFVNGREYPRKTSLRDGKSSEIMQALDGFICRALPGLVMELRLPTPISTLEKFVGRLLDTMSFVDALPSFRIRQWQVIVLLFIDALSVHRLPSIASHMASRNMLLHKVLTAAQVTGEEYEAMRDLYMPLGRLPQFSMQSGG